MDRPITTLFMLSSLDGKISPGADDNLDVDKNFPNIKGLQEGLPQYYEIEQTTDLWSLNSGRVQAKLGANVNPIPEKSPVSFVILDNSHLDEHGIRYFCGRSKQFVLVTSNSRHPGFQVKADNFHILFQEKIDLKAVLKKLKQDFDCERITIQTGGTLNGLFLREKLFDYVDIVIAPVLIGGKETSTLIDGPSITREEQLHQLGILELIRCQQLHDSYLRLTYKVIG